MTGHGSTGSVVLSMVVPAYNDSGLLAKHVPPLLECLEQLKVRYEVVVADDGSDDDGQTRAVASQLGCRYVANPVNQGKGAAVRRGMLAARGQFRIFTDADIPYELGTIERFLWYLSFKEFHMVVGDRRLENSVYFTEIPFCRRIGSHVYASIISRFLATRWFDSQCGIKGFRGQVAEDLFGVSRIKRFAFDVELLYVALKRNYDIKRLPVRLRCQEGGSVRMLRDGLTMLRDLVMVRWHELAGHYRPTKPVEIELDTSPPRAIGPEWQPAGI